MEIDENYQILPSLPALLPILQVQPSPPSSPLLYLSVRLADSKPGVAESFSPLLRQRPSPLSLSLSLSQRLKGSVCLRIS